MGSLKKICSPERLFKFWPLILAMNIEIVIIPFILKMALGLFGLKLLIISIAWGSVELFYWYHISEEILVKIKGKLMESLLFRDLIKFFKDIGRELKVALNELRIIFRRAEINAKAKPSSEDRINRILKMIWEMIIHPFDTEKYKDSKLIILAKSGSYIAMFILGSLPFGIWFSGLIVCKRKKWRTGLISLALGNAFKISYFVLGWDVVWGIF